MKLKEINISKRILFISTLITTLFVIASLVLSIIIFTHQKSNTIYGIKIIIGPSNLIIWLSLISALVSVVIIIWLNYNIFKNGFKDIFKGSTKINIIDIALYALVIILIIVVLITSIIGFTDWNQQVIIKNNDLNN